MLKTIVTIGLLQVLAILGNFIRSKTIAVLLGPAGVGVISNIDQVLQFAAYASACGIPVAAIKYLSKSHSEGAATFQRSYAALLNALLILGVGGMLLTMALLVVTPELFGRELVPYRTYIMLALPAIPSMSLGGYFVNVFAAAQKPTLSSTLIVATSIVLTIATCVGIYLSGIPGMYAANSLALGLLTIGTLVYLRSTLGLRPVDRSVSIVGEIARDRSILVFASTLYISSFAGTFALLVARGSVLTHFGAVEAGLLQSAIAIGLALNMVLNPTNALFLMPMVNRNIPQAEKMNAATEYQKRLLVMLGLAALPIILFPKLVLTILYSSRFLAAGDYLFYFVVAQCLTLLAGVYSVLIVGFDDLKMNVAITTFSALLMAFLSWLLVPHLGILGVAVGFLAQGVALFALSFAWLAWKHGFVLPRGLSMLLAYSGLALVVARMLSSGHEEWTSTVVLLKLAGCVLFALSLLLFLTEQERAMLRSGVRRYV